MPSNSGPDLVQRYVERLKQHGMPPPAKVYAPGADGGEAPIEAVRCPPLPTGARPRPAAGTPVVDPEAHPSPPPATLDFGFLQQRGFIVPGAEEKTQLSEEMRAIKRLLLRKALATGAAAIPHGNVIMVTSAQPGEGKTFTAVNLALSIASERDISVMLVDSDVYSQAALASFGLTAEKGLIDVLLGTVANVSEIMLRTNLSNLTIVPAGSKHPNASELLASQRMAQFVQEFGSQNRDRIVIIDSPPVLASSEPAVIAAQVGQIVMVLEQNRTGWHLVERSLSLLDNSREISFVLNKVEEKIWEEDFSAHYSYKK